MGGLVRADAAFQAHQEGENVLQNRLNALKADGVEFLAIARNATLKRPLGQKCEERFH